MELRVGLDAAPPGQALVHEFRPGDDDHTSCGGFVEEVGLVTLEERGHRARGKESPPSVYAEDLGALALFNFGDGVIHEPPEIIEAEIKVDEGDFHVPCGGVSRGGEGDLQGFVRSESDDPKGAGIQAFYNLLQGEGHAWLGRFVERALDHGFAHVAHHPLGHLRNEQVDAVDIHVLFEGEVRSGWCHCPSLELMRCHAPDLEQALRPAVHQDEGLIPEAVTSLVGACPQCLHIGKTKGRQVSLEIQVFHHGKLRSIPFMLGFRDELEEFFYLCGDPRNVAVHIHIAVHGTAQV